MFTRECLALEPDTSLGSVRVIPVLEQIIAERGAPQRIRTDNDTEFTSRSFTAWRLDQRTELVRIRPGKPVENAYVDSFHGRLREGCLQVSWFRNLFDARRQTETSRGNYNMDRPRSSLGYRTPLEFRNAPPRCGQLNAGVGQGSQTPTRCPTPPSLLKTGEQTQMKGFWSAS
jgi:putative transposase